MSARDYWTREERKEIRQGICPFCHGTGTDTTTDYYEYEDSDGKTQTAYETRTIKCSKCNGTGKRSF